MRCNYWMLGVLVCAAAVVARAEDRTINGTLNNLANPTWGSAGTSLSRIGSATYPDGGVTLAGALRPNPRAVSNGVFSQAGSVPNAAGVSAMLFQWGQFLDHDLDLVPEALPLQPAPIAVPTGDIHFDPFNTGTAVIPLNRSAFEAGTGTALGNPRQHTNAITHWIDASNVYGSDAARAAALRTGAGGLLRTSPGNLLPYNSAMSPLPNGMPPGSMPEDFFIAGDVRVNEQVGLIAMHTLFVREHNRLAAEIGAANPLWTDEQIYQRARKIVGAQMQVITYQEFLPTLLGEGALAEYAGYNSSLDPSIPNEFAAAGFRLGHSMLNPFLRRLDGTLNSIPEGDLALRDAFFRPDRVANEGGIEPVLLGLLSTPQQEIDTLVIDDVRNFLFGPPGAGGLDLVSLNLQRGRDHGLPDFNSLRVALGLPPHATVADLTSNAALQAQIVGLYPSLTDLDLWLGLLAEDDVPGSHVGETLQQLLAQTFGNLRDSDRLWFENDPELANLIDELRGTSLSSIMLRNTSLGFLPANAFQATNTPEPASFILFLTAACAAGCATAGLRRRSGSRR